MASSQLSFGGQERAGGPPLWPRFLLVLIVVLVGPGIGAVTPVEIAASPDSRTAGGGNRTAGAVDGDGDGFPSGVDCDDSNPLVYPGAPEFCDGLNNDCDHSQWPLLLDWVGWEISDATRAAHALDAADVDGDGDMDAVSASFWDNTVSWFENVTGDGRSWDEHPISTTADGPLSVSAADIDGDGDVDILSGSQDDGTVAWHENTAGDGSAWTAHTISTSALSVQDVIAVDVDGDGDVDALGASFGGDTIAWYENTAGDASSWTTNVISYTEGYAQSIFAADLDGDGDLDALLATVNPPFGFSSIRWYENTTGDGSNWTEHFISQFSFSTRSVFAADVDGDGDVDALAAFQADIPIVWYENSAGDGSAWIVHAISTTGSAAASVSAADLDGDGDVDVLSASFDDDAFAWFENTAGDGSAWIARPISAMVDAPDVVVAADIDGDGDADLLATSTGDDSIAWYASGSLEQDDDGDGLAECEGDCDDHHASCTLDCTRDDDLDGTTACLDCNDTDPWSYPGAGELCDGNDNACDGELPDDELDLDGDGYVECGPWTDVLGDDPQVLGGDDCDVTDAATHPGAPEVCDGASNDCADPAWPALDYWVEDTIPTRAGGALNAIAADVDGDGDMDVVSASLGDGTLAWYENAAGDASAWQPHRIARFVENASVFAADVDGDGDLDVLSASWSDDAISWYENLAGNGSSWTPHRIPFAADAPYAVLADDIDGDGDLDVLSASVDDDTFAWYENTASDGSVWAEHEISTTADGAVSVFVANVDGDGDADVVAASFYDDRVAWYERAPGGGSEWAEHNMSNAADGAYSIFAVDVDGDGDVDVLSASVIDDTIAWYENSTSVGSEWITHEISNAADGAVSVFAADLDGDGDVDVLSASNLDNTIAWYENTASDGSAWTEQVLSATTEGANSVVAVDLDGDGDLDVLSASLSDDAVAWHEHGFLEADDDGDGLAECEGDCDDTTPSCTKICTDADGDGRPACDDCDDDDAASYPEAVEQCDGNDNGCTGAVPPDELDADGDGYVACNAWDDAQGDQPSILGGSDCAPGNSAIYPDAPEVCDGRNNDCNHPSWPSLENWNEREISGAADGANAVFAADMDMDGDLDVVSGSAPGYLDTIAWHENTGSASWPLHGIWYETDGVQSVFAADVDGDGDLDVLSASFGDDTIAWHENLAPDAAGWTTHAISLTADGAWAVFGADVDGDGDLDVLSASTSDDTIAWHENTEGDGSAWAEREISVTADGAHSVFAADMDGDGDLDVLSASFSGDTIAWHENTTGNGSAWTEHEISAAADGARSVFAADMDGDGDLDVLASARWTVAWYESAPGGKSAWAEHEIWTVAQDASRSAVAADVDGDGDIDVLSRSNYSSSLETDTIQWHENLNRRGSSWATRDISITVDGPTSVFAADINGDGNVDAVTSSRFDDTIAWYEHHSLEEDLDGDGLATCAGDCDDDDPDAYPGNVEDCSDGSDNDCNGLVDADDPACQDPTTFDRVGGVQLPGLDRSRHPFREG